MIVVFPDNTHLLLLSGEDYLMTSMASEEVQKKKSLIDSFGVDITLGGNLNQKPTHLKTSHLTLHLPYDESSHICNACSCCRVCIC